MSFRHDSQQGDCVYLQEGVQCRRSLHCLFKIHRHHWPGNTGLWRHCQLLSQNPEVSVNERLTVTGQGIIVCIFLGFWTWGSSSPAGSEMLKTVARRHCGRRHRPDCRMTRAMLAMIWWTLNKYFSLLIVPQFDVWFNKKNFQFLFQFLPNHGHFGLRQKL